MSRAVEKTTPKNRMRNAPLIRVDPIVYKFKKELEFALAKTWVAKMTKENAALDARHGPVISRSFLNSSPTAMKQRIAPITE